MSNILAVQKLQIINIIEYKDLFYSPVANSQSIYIVFYTYLIDLIVHIGELPSQFFLFSTDSLL